MSSKKSLQTASSQLSFAYANRAKDDCRQLEVRRSGGEERAGTFHGRAASAVPFICHWERLDPRAGCPAAPRPVGAMPVGRRILAPVPGVSHGHVPWAEVGSQVGCPQPSHTCARGWGDVGQPVEVQPMVLWWLPKHCTWGFVGRIGNTESFISFFDSRCFNGEHCAAQPSPLCPQSPDPAGPVVALGSPGLAVSKSHGSNDPCSAMLTHLPAFNPSGHKAEVLFF